MTWSPSAAARRSFFEDAKPGVGGLGADANVARQRALVEKLAMPDGTGADKALKITETRDVDQLSATSFISVNFCGPVRMKRPYS